MTGVKGIAPFKNHPTKFFISLKNGAVCIYDLQKHKMEFLTQAGHAETVFDIEFKPENKNIFASCSFDGSIKIWDIRTMHLKKSLQLPAPKNVEKKEEEKKGTTIFYGIVWSPMKDERLAAVTAIGELILFDVLKEKVLSRITPGANNPIFRVDWNHLDPELIVVGSSDNNWYIRQVTKQLSDPSK